MLTKETTKNQHLTIDERLEIQKGLDYGLTFKAIAKRIGKDPTTVSKEVKKHLIIRPSNVRITDLDGNPKDKQPCPHLLKAPFVCNACDYRRRSCKFDKHLYEAKIAQKDYKTVLVESREGIPLTKQEFYDNDKIISDGLKKGQRLYHIVQTHELNVSIPTIYRYLRRGYLSVNSLDFPRVAKFKPHRKRRESYIPAKTKTGRTYDVFLAFIEENDITNWVEMDTLIGRIGGKTIMTFDFTFCNFMFGLLLDDKSATQAAEKIVSLKRKFSEKGKNFSDIFPLLLTDNGGEFSNIWAFENDLDGQKETSVFFCNPYRACEKPHIEKNHTLFRDICPKGVSFDDFTQEKVNLIFSHINSVKRKNLNGKTPYEMFAFTYGTEIAEILGVSIIPPTEVVQSPLLLK